MGHIVSAVNMKDCLLESAWMSKGGNTFTFMFSCKWTLENCIVSRQLYAELESP